MRSLQIKTWYAVHKWTSLVCTLFLLVICLTGLPLVFQHEIEAGFRTGKAPAALPAGTPRASLDRVAGQVLQRHPGERIDYLYLDPDEPTVLVGLVPPSASGGGHAVHVDARTAEVLLDGPSYEAARFSFMGIMLALHTDLYAGLAGELFLGSMGLLFVVAIVSGVVLYGPFMKKLEFGTVRAARSRRIKWLDLHNLLGIVTLAWGGVVGVTGVINELSTPLFSLWQRNTLPALLAAAGAPAPAGAGPASPQRVAEVALEAVPGMSLTSMNYPGSPYGSPRHFIVWLQGNTPLTSRTHTAVLVDGASGSLVKVAALPWYLTALEVSRPLHFGDYGGLPLKVLWALLDLATIVVLASGLYLWIARRKAGDARLAELARRRQAEVRENAA
ncbi:MAG TPA: PepSY-associated TM helix domain-containing protein [Bordetella sp.]